MFKNIHFSQDSLKATFELQSVPVSIANALRRTLLVEIPIPAIDRESVSFKEEDNNINTSNFHDEFLIHRISFVRLQIDPSLIQSYQLLICNPNTHDLPFVNESDDTIDYSAHDMIVKFQDTVIPSHQIFQYNVLITRLKPGQQIKASMKIDNRSVRPKGSLTNQSGNYRYHYQPCRIKFCYKNARHEDGKTMTPDDELQYLGHQHKSPQAFLFEIHAFGSKYLDAKKLMESTFLVLQSKLKILKSFFDGQWIDDDPSNSVSSKPSITPDPILSDTMIMRVAKEDHTLGNMLAEKLRTLLDQSPSSKNFVAYQKEHPLQDTLILKLKIDPSKVHMTHSQVFQSCVSQLLDDVLNLEKNWLNSIGLKPAARKKYTKKNSAPKTKSSKDLTSVAE